MSAPPGSAATRAFAHAVSTARSSAPALPTSERAEGNVTIGSSCIHDDARQAVAVPPDRGPDDGHAVHRDRERLVPRVIQGDEITFREGEHDRGADPGVGEA